MVNYNNDVETDDIIYPRTSQISSSYEGMQIRGGKTVWTPSVPTPKRQGPYDFPASHLGNSLESQLLPSHSGQPPDGQTTVDSQVSNIRLESQKSIQSVDQSKDHMPGSSNMPQYLHDHIPTVVARPVDEENVVQELSQELEAVRKQQDKEKESTIQIVKEEDNPNDDKPKLPETKILSPQKVFQGNYCPITEENLCGSKGPQEHFKFSNDNRLV